MIYLLYLINLLYLDAYGSVSTTLYFNIFGSERFFFGRKILELFRFETASNLTRVFL